MEQIGDAETLRMLCPRCHNYKANKRVRIEDPLTLEFNLCGNCGCCWR